jgi:hypothetical protein
VKRLMAGAYVDEHGALHLDVPELLRENGYADTPANRRMIAQAAQEVARRWGFSVKELGDE